MKEAMDWAAKNGGISGSKIKQGMYQKKDWVPAGLEGVCVPSTWTPDDHRGTTTVAIYRAKVSGATEASVDELVKAGTIKLEKVTSIDLPRKKEWLGWENPIPRRDGKPVPAILSHDRIEAMTAAIDVNAVPVPPVVS